MAVLGLTAYKLLSVLSEVSVHGEVFARLLLSGLRCGVSGFDEDDTGDGDGDGDDDNMARIPFLFGEWRICGDAHDK